MQDKIEGKGQCGSEDCIMFLFLILFLDKIDIKNVGLKRRKSVANSGDWLKCCNKM